jgi:hypothetical protein
MPSPSDPRVATVDHGVHVRVSVHPESFGHFVRDTLQYLVNLPHRFGQDPVDYMWLRYVPWQRLSAAFFFLCWMICSVSLHAST